MPYFCRRSFLTLCAAAALTPARGRGEKPSPPPIGLGFSLYGMRSLPLEEALAVCAEIGYDCVELPVMQDWPADALTFSTQDQEAFRRALERRNLRLSSVMENLTLAADDAQHAANLERLAAAGRILGRLAPEGPRVLETVLGGRPELWPSLRERMAARLKDWARTAEDGEFTIAIKAHVGGALHTPEDCVWLAAQAASSRVKCVYDYSHFQLRGIDLPASIRTLVPHSAFIHVKDAQGDAAKFQFLLPGEGSVDYVQMLKLVAAAGYQGDVVVEVSGQIFSKPEYRPRDAARQCYEKLAAAFEQAGVRRG